MRAGQRSDQNIGYAAKPVEEGLNRLIKETDERGEVGSGNHDIPIPLQLIVFEAILHT